MQVVSPGIKTPFLFFKRSHLFLTIKCCIVATGDAFVHLFSLWVSHILLLFTMSQGPPWRQVTFPGSTWSRFPETTSLRQTASVHTCRSDSSCPKSSTGAVPTQIASPHPRGSVPYRACQLWGSSLCSSLSRLRHFILVWVSGFRFVLF